MMKLIKIVLLSTLFALYGISTAFAQRVALKTNLLYLATTTPNLGLEVATGQKQSMQVYYALNPWEFKESTKTKHWVVQPEYRWWFCQRFNGAFWGIHAHGGQFNMGGIDLPFGIFSRLGERRYEGWFAGGGLIYGYQWPLSRHLALEASIGAGYTYINYKEFLCATCGRQTADTDRHYFGITKVAFSVSYFF